MFNIGWSLASFTVKYSKCVLEITQGISRDYLGGEGGGV